MILYGIRFAAYRAYPSGTFAIVISIRTDRVRLFWLAKPSAQCRFLSYKIRLSTVKYTLAGAFADRDNLAANKLSLEVKCEMKSYGELGLPSIIGHPVKGTPDVASIFILAGLTRP
ncbi:hypothetical protein FD733_19015 [Pantoea sp. Eser]|nr:hypothetical protein [Pantoea sp. Eser]